MKKIIDSIIFVMILAFMIGCEKDVNIDLTNETNSYSNQIILKGLEVVGDSVKLTWSKLDTLKFSGYLIIRKDKIGMTYNPQDNNGQYLVTKIYDPSVTSYIDKNIPIASYLEYQVIGLLSNNYSYNYIYSNSKTYERPTIKTFEFSVLDIIPDLSNNRFYFIESNNGKITIFDYETLSTLKTITSDATIGYCSIGINGNVRELYVPRSDGWVFIYNAETLEKIDQIDIGHPSSCVVNNNGKLFISTDTWTNRPLKSFNRTTKKLIAENGDFEDTRLRIIPNTNSGIIEVTLHIGPTDLDYYNFDSNGNFLSHQNDRYHGDYPLDADIFQFFPDGKKFITASEGAIYDINLNYINRLPKGNFLFTDYAFNANATIIYCACSNSKSIVSYSILDFNKIKEYKTLGYPFRIYRKENELICISKTTKSDGYYNNSYQLVIEKIKL